MTVLFLRQLTTLTDSDGRVAITAPSTVPDWWRDRLTEEELQWASRLVTEAGRDDMPLVEDLLDRYTGDAATLTDAADRIYILVGAGIAELYEALPDGDDCEWTLWLAAADADADQQAVDADIAAPGRTAPPLRITAEA